jgi:hypothetical protein
MSVPTGFSIAGTPVTSAGTLALTYGAGYEGFLTASGTAWTTFYNTPSNRITAGTGIDWTTNTLNTVLTAGDGLTLTVEDFDCDIASGSVFGCLSTTDWNAFDDKVSSTSIDTSAELAALLTDETGSAGSAVFSVGPTFTGTPVFSNLRVSTTGTTTLGYASTTALTVAGQTYLGYASSTGVSGTNLNFTNSTSTSLAVSTTFNFLGTVITNIATWFSTTLNAVSAFIAAGSSTWDFGGAASLEVPNGTGPTVDATGETALDTTSDQFVYYGASAKKVLGNGNQYASFTYATSTAWTGTTTIPLGVAPLGETWTQARCFTDTGTLNVSFSDGTNRMNAMNASTTVGVVTLSTNNTFTENEKRYVDIGTPASSPLKVSCTITKSITAD